MYRALNSHNAGHFAAMDVALQLEEVYFRVVEDAAADVATLVDGTFPSPPPLPHPTCATHSVFPPAPLARTDNPLAPYPTRLVVQALLLLKSLLGDWDGSTGLAVPPGFVQQLAHLLITRMLPLRQDDLDKWTEDPEEWMNEEEAERWEFELRVSF